MDRTQLLLGYYDEFPFEHHPLWRAVLGHELSLAQVLSAEVQHWIRTKRGQPLRKAALEQAEGRSPVIYEALKATYIDECTDEGGENHLALIQRLLKMGGIALETLNGAKPTPGNGAAMALYKEIGTVDLAVT